MQMEAKIMLKRHTPTLLSNVLLGAALCAYATAFVAMFSMATGIGPDLL